MIYQDPLGALDRRLPVLAQVREPLDIHELGAPQTRQPHAMELLTRVGLSSEQADALSARALRRAAPARGARPRAGDAGPTSWSATSRSRRSTSSIQAQVVNLLVDLQAQLGLAMLFISHDLRIVRQVSNRVAVMYLGDFVECGDADDLFADPLHPYTRALVSAAPVTTRSCAPATHRADGRAAQSGQPALRLQLPSALPARDRAMPRRSAGAAAGRRARRPARRLPPRRRRCRAHQQGGADAALLRDPASLRALITIALVVTFAFIVLRLSGDPAQIILGPEAPPEVIAAFRKSWGLDDPIWQQYFRYFGGDRPGRARPLDARRPRRRSSSSPSASRRRWR